jgi:glycosyltransferase involved in cell wall biosynthesis
VRLLFATTQSYLPQRVGGSQRSTHELSVALAARGLNVAVLCELDCPFDWTHIQNRTVATITGRSYPCDRWRPYRIYRGVDAASGVREVAHAFCPDVAIVHAGIAIPLVHAFLEGGIRTVVYFRDVQFELMGGPVPRHERVRFLANSAFTASRAALELGIEATVVQPVVSRETYQTTNRGRHVLFVNPVAKKGVQTAIELAGRNPDIPFVFLESWPMDARAIESLARALAPLRNVTFRRATLQMANEYAEARMLLVPSVWEEAWGRVVTEAQVSGIPVLASAIGGLAESVGPGGVLVPPGSSIDVWHEHLRRLWDSGDEYARYQRQALDHSRRPDIDRDRLLTKFLDAVSGW